MAHGRRRNTRQILPCRPSSVFGLSEWWDVVGRTAHAMVFLIVPQYISIPPSNGYQERVFSACTYFDRNIQQRLKDEKYELKVLLAVNERLVGEGNKEVDPLLQWVCPLRTEDA